MGWWSQTWQYLTGAGATPNATVGAPDSVGPGYSPGDPHGLEIVDDDVTPENRMAAFVPSPWDGWPSSWASPQWGNLGPKFDDLVDAAWAALDLNSSVLSAMPLYRTRNSQVMPPRTWMTNPDPDIYTGWPEFMKQAVWDYQNGETFVLATSRDATGWPYSFRTLPPWLMNVEMVGGRRRCSIGELDVTDDILHIRYKSTTDSARGIGPLETGKTRMVAAAVLARYASEIASGGGIPKYVLETDQQLTKQQADELKEQWWASRMQDLGTPWKPAVLSGGVKANPLQLNPQDMALMELSQYTEARIVNLLGVPGFLLGLPGGDSMTYCLSDDTEILTRRGWLTCDQVTTDDIALTLDHDSGVSEWQPIAAVNTFDVVDEPMLEMQTRAHSSLSTLSHRWPIVGRSNGARRWVTSETIGQEHALVLAAPCVDLPSEAKYSDDFVELVAWFTTEGYLNRDHSRTWSTIAQSSVRNPVNTATIRAALTRMFGPARLKGQRDLAYVKRFGDDPAWVEDVNSGNGMIAFRLNHEATSFLVEVTEGDAFEKAISYDFLLSLTSAQLRLFIDTCIAGDGSSTQGRGDQRVFIQKEGPRVDRFRFACTLAGISTTVYPRTGSDCVTVGIKKRVTYNPTFHNVSPPVRVTWSGRVWCPTTPNGTWYARRNGREFFTGNSNATSLFDFHDRRFLKPAAVHIMSALSGWALPRGQSVELNRDEYSRPPLKERAEAYEKLAALGALSSEEIRVMERLVDAGTEPAPDESDEDLVAAEALTGGGRS